MIVLSEISLQRGVQTLLEKASLRINPGQHIGITGRNGCGKSSLFQLLQGEMQLDAGSISVPPNWRMAHMAQEVSSSDRTALDYVLDGDKELRRVQAVIAQAEMDEDNNALAHGYADLEALHGYDADYRAEQLLHGLGFLQAQCHLPVNSFSGGWRIRLNLAQALISRSDLLLLDEPTNHLDLEATLWLEQWLKAYPGTLLIISHDREFLDNVVDGIVHVENQQLNYYRGNYSSFEKARAVRLAETQASFDKQQRRVAEIEDFVRRFRAKASKAKQAQSRIKELERMELISLAHVDSPFHFSFRDSEKTSSPLLVLRDADIGYGERALLQKVHVNLQPGARIGLLGVNGAGKSTLIKALVGDLPLLAGERVMGEHLAIGYFAQHQLEALDMNASALLHIQRISPSATEQSIRNFLGSFDFHADKALEPIAPFSGGEKARLALAMVVWQRPNLLLLDEPTNHLDLEMREALTEALLGYGGALVVISHDRHLLRNSVDEFWRVHDGAVTEFDGTLEDYHKQLHKPSAAVAERPLQTQNTEQDRKVQRKQSAQSRQAQAPLRKRIGELEKQMASRQKQLADIEQKLSDAALYEAAQKLQLQKILEEQGVLRKQIDDLETEWLAVQEQLESTSEDS
ncbi:MAG: ATP-binding cassette domain-containing protein [Pseudomonadales bacterium]|jgi:ATP-binding cassette subfamily F protein 3|nr:ATP-binding cassette domain-containing protein [Pseudomonadales bacterium]